MNGLVVVTGASTGIGRETAILLSQRGFDVIAGVRTQEAGGALLDHAPVEPVIVDVTDPRQIAALRDAVGDRPLAGLVNNAGVTVSGPLEFMPLDEFRRQLEVNLVGHLAVTQALLEPLRMRAGRIVSVGSVGGRVGLPFLGAYSASKSGLWSITEALRGELRPWGIHASVVDPGSIATPIWDKAPLGIAKTIEALGPRGQELYGEPLGRTNEIAESISRGAIPPKKVAEAIHHALTARRPKARYLVGRDAWGQVLARGLLGHRLFDRVVARQMGL